MILTPPCLNNQKTTKDIAIKNEVSTRTLHPWAQKYEHEGPVGLISKTRTDFEQIRVLEEVRQKTEELALRHKKINKKTL
ncbi:helix-turn-helix domain-containing protein [Enterococcus faecium]|uniref:helix-turn-helix domain-containing protein n=1 Tax=Enterococcus faecium TaxID=1352 RepID=UPI000A350FE9|nr:helix-turn-helix domain-containing protein [Enterococcus faecium]